MVTQWWEQLVNWKESIDINIEKLVLKLEGPQKKLDYTWRWYMYSGNSCRCDIWIYVCVVWVLLERQQAAITSHERPNNRESLSEYVWHQGWSALRAVIHFFFFWYYTSEVLCAGNLFSMADISVSVIEYVCGEWVSYECQREAITLHEWSNNRYHWARISNTGAELLIALWVISSFFWY